MNTSTSNSPSSRDSGFITPLGGRASQQALPRDVSSLGMGLLPGPAVNAMGAGRGPQRPAKLPRELNPEEQQELRRRINSRERKRMQDLNMAMDALREVMMPYSSPAAQDHPHHSRRLSKISTLILARNYILLLGSSLQEMRRLLGEVSVGMGVGVGRGVGLGESPHGFSWRGIGPSSPPRSASLHFRLSADLHQELRPTPANRGTYSRPSPVVYRRGTWGPALLLWSM